MDNVIIEPHAITRLGTLVDFHSWKRLFFVLDPVAYEASGAGHALEKTVMANHDVFRMDDFEINPKLEDVQRGVAACRQFAADAVIAIGGGTSMDLAKMISLLASGQPSPVRESLRGETSLSNRVLPLVAIPTTAGSGSEATHFAVVYIDQVKHSLAHPSLLPDYALIDPELCHSMPRQLTVATGLDALSQAMESIWSVGADNDSLEDAKQALQLAWTSLANAAELGSSADRLAMSRASYLAGRAINRTKTTAPHAFSYAMTTHHQVPHGLAVAITLPGFLQHNWNVNQDDCQDPRGPDSVRGRIEIILETFGASSIKSGCDKLNELLDSLSVPASVAEWDIVGTALDRVARSANVERLSNNPREVGFEQIQDMLQKSRNSHFH